MADMYSTPEREKALYQTFLENLGASKKLIIFRRTSPKYMPVIMMRPNNMEKKMAYAEATLLDMTPCLI